MIVVECTLHLPSVTSISYFCLLPLSLYNPPYLRWLLPNQLPPETIHTVHLPLTANHHPSAARTYTAYDFPPTSSGF